MHACMRGAKPCRLDEPGRRTASAGPLPCSIALADCPAMLPAARRQAYECLALLEGTSMKAQRALESGTHVNLTEAKNLNSYFQKVLPST